MNTPCLWFEPHDFPERLAGVYDRERSPDDLLLIQGKPLEVASPVVFHFAAPRPRVLKFDVLPNNISIPLISPRVASILGKLCPSEFELIPARINTRDLPIEDYSLLNVLGEISGMDHARSSFTMLPGGEGILGVELLRYRSGAMGKRHMAREREYHVYLWVSETLVRVFNDERISACSFEPPESIHP